MKILALVEGFDHVCCRYRLRAFEPALRTSGCRVTYRALRRGAGMRTLQLLDARQFDAVILQRKLLPRWQLGLLSGMARRLIFDFDDAVLYRDSYHRHGLYSRSRARRFAATVRAADTVIAGNGFLAGCAIRSGAARDHVIVVPTCINVGRYPDAAFPTDRDGLQLVWIGSSSTLKGLVRQASLWDRLGSRFPGLAMRIICDAFPEFQSLPVIPVRWSELTEASDIAHGDVGISWMPDDLWSRGKCGLKVLQYQAAWLPVIANPVGVHSSMLEHGVSGFLVTTEHEWFEAVRALAADSALRRRMGETGRASVEANFSVAKWTPKFLAIVKSNHIAPGSGAAEAMSAKRH